MLGLNKLNKTAAPALMAAGILLAGFMSPSEAKTSSALNVKVGGQKMAVKKAITPKVGWYNGNIREFLA